jgi:hypothetical protein
LGLKKRHAPLILYSPTSWLLELLMLRDSDALEPTVSTRSKPGASRWLGCKFSLLVAMAGLAPGRRVKGLRMVGMMGVVESGLRSTAGGWRNGMVYALSDAVEQCDLIVMQGNVELEKRCRCDGRAGCSVEGEEAVVKGER